MRDVPLVILIAAVAVLAGVTVVALGRGGEMAHFQADYSPLKLEEVTATDVVLFRPPFTLWGYNTQATDEALSRIADALTERDIELTALRQEVADLQWTAGGRADPRPERRGEKRGPAVADDWTADEWGVSDDSRLVVGGEADEDATRAEPAMPQQPPSAARPVSRPPFPDAPRPAGRPPRPDSSRPDAAAADAPPDDVPPSGEPATAEPPVRKDEYPGLRGVSGGGGPAALSQTNPRFRLPRDDSAAGEPGDDADEEEDGW